MIDLFKITDEYTFRLINLIFIGLIILSYFYGKKFITSKLDKTILDKGIVIKGKEYSYNKLIKQVLLISSIFLIYAAFGYGNPKFSLSKVLSFELLSRNPGSDSGFHLSIGQIVAVIVLIFLAKVFVNLIRIILYKTFKDKEWIDDSRKYTLIQLSRYVIYVLCVIIILKILFGDISNIVLASSALFVGLGLGLQKFFTDMVSGFIILNDGSIKVGDVLEMNGHIAMVEKISIRTSHIKTMEGKIIIVPNSKFTEEHLVNWSISDEVTRFHIDIRVAYGSNTAKVKELLYNIALNHPLVDKQKEILVLFDNFGENALQFQLYFWARNTWRMKIIMSDLRYEIDRVFRENNIQIPFPQRDLHIKSDATK